MSQKWNDWGRAATRAVGMSPGESAGRRTAMHIHVRTVWFGIVRDNCPEIGLKDLSSLGGLRTSCHSSVHGCLERWAELHWRERHGWLVLADGFYAGLTDKEVWTTTTVATECMKTAEEFAEEVRQKRSGLREFTGKIRIKGHYDER